MGDDIEQRVTKLENQWVIYDENGQACGKTNAASLQELSIQALTGLAQVARRHTQTGQADMDAARTVEPFEDWLVGIADRYYLTDHEVTAILLGVTVNEPGGNSAWYADFEALWRWWQTAYWSPNGREYSDWHDGLVRVLMRMPSWRERRAVAISRKTVRDGSHD